MTEQHQPDSQNGKDRKDEDVAAAEHGYPHDKENNEEYTGLCAHCAKRDVCVLPRPNGGVWHCEEYC